MRRVRPTGRSRLMHAPAAPLPPALPPSLPRSVPSVSSDDLEDELALEVELDAGGGEALRAGAAAAARALLPLIEAELRKLLEAIRQR